MIRSCALFTLIGLGLLQVNPAVAQPGMGMAGGPSPVDAMFLAAAPELGDAVPDLTIVDRDGNPVNMRELARENYTVLVLGCLT